MTAAIWIFSWNMSLVAPSPLFFVITERSKKRLLGISSGKSSVVWTICMSEISFIEISRARISWLITKVVSRSLISVFPKRLKRVSLFFLTCYPLINSNYYSCIRHGRWFSSSSSISSRFRLLDGTWSRQANIVHSQGRYLECWLFDRRDAYRSTPLGSARSNAGYFQGRKFDVSSLTFLLIILVVSDWFWSQADYSFRRIRRLSRLPSTYLRN